jgi:hypothetical protein
LPPVVAVLFQDVGREPQPFSGLRDAIKGRRRLDFEAGSEPRLFDACSRIDGVGNGGNPFRHDEM